MNIISWNTRGFGNSDFRRAIRDMTCSYKPDLYILTETRLRGDKATSIISSLGYERYAKIDSMGFTGGIWILLNPTNIIVEPVTTTFHEVYLKIQVNSLTFVLTAIYAPPHFSNSDPLWEKLSYIYDFIPLPWLIMGDFNEISNEREKFGGNQQPKMKMRTFNNFLNKAKLLDLGYCGPKYT